METSIKFIYDFPYVKQIIGYLLIPFLIFIILCSIILLIYSAKHKDHKDPIYQYRINLASLIVSILLVLVFLAILVGFALALKQQVDQMSGKYVVSYVVFGAPIVPVIALLVLFIKIFKLIKNKPKREEIVQIEENSTIMVQEPDNNQVQMQKDINVMMQEPDNNQVQMQKDINVMMQEPNNNQVQMQKDINVMMQEPNNNQVQMQKDATAMVQEPNNIQIRIQEIPKIEIQEEKEDIELL